MPEKQTILESSSFYLHRINRLQNEQIAILNRMAGSLEAIKQKLDLLITIILYDIHAKGGLSISMHEKVASAGVDISELVIKKPKKKPQPQQRKAVKKHAKK